jgi:hypothetical protein
MSDRTSLLDFLTKCPTIFHLIDTVSKVLLSAGFTLVSESALPSDLPCKYFLTRDDRSLVAINRTSASPSLVLSAAAPFPSIQVVDVRKSRRLLKTGVNVQSWYDRDVRLAGKLFPSSLFVSDGAAARLQRSPNETLNVYKTPMRLDAIDETLFLVDADDPSFAGFDGSLLTGWSLAALLGAWTSVTAFLSTEAPPAGLICLAIAEGQFLRSALQTAADERPSLDVTAETVGVVAAEDGFLGDAKVTIGKGLIVGSRGLATEKVMDIARAEGVEGFRAPAAKHRDEEVAIGIAIGDYGAIREVAAYDDVAKWVVVVQAIVRSFPNFL